LASSVTTTGLFILAMPRCTASAPARLSWNCHIVSTLSESCDRFQVIFASQNIAPLQAPPNHSASCSSICIRLILHHDRCLPQGCNSNVNMPHNLIADGLELGRNRRNPSLQSYTGMNRSHGAHNGQDMQASAYYHEGSKLNLNQKRRSVPPNTFEN